MLRAWKELRRIKREDVSRIDVMIAQLVALTANINRDSKKVPKPFKLQDFCLYREREKEENGIGAVPAAIAMDLHAEGRCPPLLIAMWPQVLSALKEGTKLPDIRALHSDDEAVWVFAPKWEGLNIRGALVVVRGRFSAPVRLRDLDRPLNVYDVRIPERQGFGWVEGGCLLLDAES